MEIDPYAIVARRFAAGDPVGEGYLYGLEACEMIKRRLVDEQTMKSYRSGAFLARRERYGQDAALAWEAQAKADHEIAKQMLRDADTERRAVRLPRMKPHYSEAME